MVSFYLSFRSILINEIVKEEGTLCNDGGSSWLSINRGSYQGKRVQVVDGDFCPCGRRIGGGRVSSLWLIF